MHLSFYLLAHLSLLAGQTEAALPPDEELAPDDLFAADDAEGTGSPANNENEADESDTEQNSGKRGDAEALTDATAASSEEEGQAPADPDQSSASADELEEDSFLDEDLMPMLPSDEESVGTTAVPIEVVARTAAEISSALTIGLVGCGIVSLAAVVIAVIGSPVVTALFVLNAFAPAVAIPLCGGSLVISQSMVGAASWAACVAVPLPLVSSTASGIAGASAQIAITDPWLPLGAAALAALPGILVALGAAGVVLFGAGYGVSVQNINWSRLSAGEREGVYLNLPRAITGGVIVLIGSAIGLLAAPVSGGAAVAAGMAVAQITDPAQKSVPVLVPEVAPLQSRATVPGASTMEISF